MASEHDQEQQGREENDDEEEDETPMRQGNQEIMADEKMVIDYDAVLVRVRDFF